MYQIDDRQSLSLWTVLLILPLFFIIGWSSRGMLDTDAREFTSNFMRGSFIQERYQEPKIVIPIPDRDMVKPHDSSQSSGPVLNDSPVNAI